MARAYDWACFVSQQAAEKAVKAVHLRRGQEAWGHLVRRLLADLPTDIGVPEGLLERARFLDAHYIPTRYPNGHPEGAPFEQYGAAQAAQAIANAEAIIEFCRSAVAGAA